MNDNIGTRTPWSHRRWRGGTARSDLRFKAGLFITIALLLLAVVVFMGVKTPEMFSPTRGINGVFSVIFVWPLTLGAAVCAFLSLRAARLWFSFRKCVVHMATVPGVIGGRFTGVILVPESIQTASHVKMRLVCERTSSSTTEHNSDTSNRFVESLWSNSLCIPMHSARRGGSMYEVPFEFAIPFGLPDETDSNKESRGQMTLSTRSAWALRVNMRTISDDLELKFHVPVFRTSESDPQLSHHPEQDSKGDSEKPETSLRVEVTTGQRETTFTCRSNSMRWSIELVAQLTAGLYSTVLGFVFGQSIIPLVWKELIDQCREGFLSIAAIGPILAILLIPTGCLLFSLLGLHLTSSAVLRRYATRSTSFTQGHASQILTIFGISRTRRIDLSTKDSVAPIDTMAPGSERAGFKVSVKTYCSYLRQRTILVATDILTKQEATRLAQSIEAIIEKGP